MISVLKDIAVGSIPVGLFIYGVYYAIVHDAVVMVITIMMSAAFGVVGLALLLILTGVIGYEIRNTFLPWMGKRLRRIR